MHWPIWALRGLVRLLVLPVLGVIAPPPLAAQAAGPPPAATLALDAARRATVFIEVRGADGTASGSGIIVTSSGTVATAAHVIHGATSARVKLVSGEVFDVAGVLDYDERLDVALLAIPGFNLPVATLGNSDSAVVGQRLIAIGAPLGLETTVSDGLLSASRLDGGTRLFQVSIPVSHGSSGGPVITERGEVVGLVVSGVEAAAAQNINFVLPINYVRGKLGLIGSKAPTPLSEVRYGAGPVARGRAILAPTDAAASNPGVGSTGVALPRLNDSLPLDWKLLDGVELFSEEKGEGQIRFKSLVRYAVTTDPTGALVVERTTTRRVRSQGLVAGVDLADDLDRTLYQVGPVNKWSVTASRQSYQASVAAGSSMLQVDGSRFTGSATAAPPVSGDAPPGVLPITLIGGAIAAYTGDLPTRLQVWVLDPQGNRAIPEIVEITGNDRRKVPIAKPGSGCGPGAKTEDVMEDVVTGTRTISTQRVAITLLAQPPHLLVDETVKCVRLPAP